jgi:thiol-disulfide isomerase/thioredoxin
MRSAAILLLLASLATPLVAQDNSDEPTSEKAQKTYKQALDYVHQRQKEAALDAFKKADKQDDGRCVACQKKMIKYGMELHDWKIAEQAAGELIAEAQEPKKIASAHYQLGVILRSRAIEKHKDELFTQVHDEMSKALAADPNYRRAIFLDGQALARMKQDDAAKAQFQRFIDLTKEDTPDRERAQRYLEEPALARANMAPAFAVTTLDGKEVSLDDLEGKVVLVDFWATWCAPCRAAMPHIREIAKKFQDQPLVILSVSLDKDEDQWKEFVAKNGMTWLNYRDGGFTGPIAKLFGVEAIPHTFSIDADGVLQDEHIGDASIEGKLKKLVARARQEQVVQKPAESQ